MKQKTVGHESDCNSKKPQLNIHAVSCSVVNCWRSCLSDPPKEGERIEVLYDDGFHTPDEIIKHTWTGRENIQEVMYCFKGWRACT